MYNSQQLRREMRTKCTQITAQYRQNAAERAVIQLQNSHFLDHCQYIACYKALAYEFNTEVLIRHLWQLGKKCYLPVIDDYHSGKMHFAAYHSNDQLVANKWGILEPQGQLAIAIEKIQLIIMPLLAFDRSGNRLGTGGGYYDRALAKINIWQQAPILCGWAYACQQVDRIVTQTWDIAMDAIITERELIIVGGGHVDQSRLKAR